MRKIYLLFTLFAVLASQEKLRAQTVTIPTANTNSGSLNDPLGTYFGYERTAMIYTPGEVASPGIISSIGFYLNAVSSPSNSTDVRIYIKQRPDLFTAVTTYTTETTGATLVYGPTTIPAASFIAGQWITIPLATNFTYNGTSNLEVIVETNYTGGGGEGSTGKQFRVALQPTDRYYQRWQADATAPPGTGTFAAVRPNIQVTFSNPPCVSGSLAGGTALSAVGAACAGVGFDLTIAPASASFGSGMTYQWESSPNGAAPWSPIAGATGLNANVTQTAVTHYRRKMTCSAVDAYSTIVQVNQNAFLDCYCNSGLTGTVNGVDIITNVSLTNFTAANYANASTSNAANYISYNNTPFDLSQQTSNSLAITFGSDGSQFSAAWIDYNQNGVFESSENIALAGTSAAGNTTVTYNFDIPATATLGNTRLRVRGGSDGAYSLGGACNTTPFGETEDYIVNITAPPACIPPANIGISTLGTTTVTINWTAPTPGPADGYEWELRSSGAAGSGATGLEASGTTAAGITTANVVGLTANTAYTLYVRSACTTGTSYSVWGRPVAFKTLCAVIAAFPFTETFEAASPTRSCWSQSLTGGTVNWKFETGAGNGGSIDAAYGGTLNATHYGSGSGTVAKLISPAFDFSAFPVYGAQLSFWYGNEDFFGDLNELRVYYKTSAAGAWTLIPGAEFTRNVGAWTQVELLLPSSTGSDYYIAFEGTELFGFGVVIDDVVVSAAPSCPKPTLVKALGISTSRIDVSFTAPGNDFIVEYGAVGFTPGTGAAAGTGGTIVTGTASPISITGLPVNTAYDVYLRRVCVAGADYSANVLSKTNTLCAAVDVPYTQDFNGVTLPNIPACTSVQDLNESPTWQTVVPSATSGWNGNALRYSYDSDKGADDWFYIQGLNLTGGVTYELDYKYGATDPLYPERMKVAYGTMATASAMTTVLKDYPAIVANSAAPFAKLERLIFTPATTGVY
ncbi:MAG: GEVED domain-containing protein, partial [Chitinophagaceae bacterium]